MRLKNRGSRRANISFRPLKRYFPAAQYSAFCFRTITGTTGGKQTNFTSKITTRGTVQRQRKRGKKKEGPASSPESYGGKCVAPPDGPPGKPGCICQETAVLRKALQDRRERRQQLSICHHTVDNDRVYSDE